MEEILDVLGKVDEDDSELVFINTKKDLRKFGIG